jgi:hypothetical protein
MFLNLIYWKFTVFLGRWFSPGTPASSTTNAGRHDIAEIMLKAALNTKKEIKSNKIIKRIRRLCHWWQHFQCTTIQKTFNEVNQEDYRFICDICSYNIVWIQYYENDEVLPNMGQKNPFLSYIIFLNASIVSSL